MRFFVVLSLFLLLTTGCADQLILHPSTAPANAGGAQQRMIHNEGADIEAFIAESPGAKQSGEAKLFDLEFCGNATRAEHIAQYVADRWQRRPVEVWVMNYPGYGASTGPAKLDAIAPAALATYDALAVEAHGKPIIVSGSSLGSAVALYVATQRSAAALILQNPPPLQRMIMEEYGWLVPSVVVAQIPEQLNSLSNAPRVKVPAIFILSGPADRTVPPKFQQMVVDAYAGEKHLIRMPDAGHNAPVTGNAAEQFQQELDALYKHLAD